VEAKENSSSEREKELAAIDREIEELEAMKPGIIGEYEKKRRVVTEKGVIKAIPKLDLICLNTVEVEDIQWLWYPYIARGKVTIIQGEPGSSKTTMGLKIAACTTTGEAFPGEPQNPFAKPRMPANVIYQTAEDGLSDTIMNRLKHMNPDFSRIFVIDETNEPVTMMDDRIRQALNITKAELIILDPLTAYIGSKVNMNMANEVRPVMNRAVQFAKEFNAAVVIIAHMSKMTSAQAKNRLIGSIDFVGAARSVLTIGFNPNNPDQRALAQTKNNLAPFGKTILYHLDYKNGVVVFDNFSDMKDDDITSPADKKNTKASIALEEAKDFLKEAMKESYIKADEVLQMAADEGIKSTTLHEAKKALGIKSKRYGYGKNSTNWWKYPNYEVPKELIENSIDSNP
jgi:RecA-family ATPase